MNKHKLTQKEIAKLQEILVQNCIDFVNQNNIDDLDEIIFTVDSIQSSSKYNSWQPCTDSSISAYGYDRTNGRILLQSYM